MQLPSRLKEAFMLRLTGLGVRNLRSLRDTGVIDLKPITVLVGKNSAGKSTFARVLPLLKQSAERRKQGPVLWFGRLVDFGSFQEAISSFAESAAIDIAFRFGTPSATYVGRRTTRPEQSEMLEGAVIDARLSIASEGEDGRTVFRELALSIFGVEVLITSASAREVLLKINGQQVLPPSEGRILVSQGAILPALRVMYRDQVTTPTVSDATYFRAQRAERLGTTEVRAAISTFVHGNTLPERKDEIARRLPIASPSVLLEHCRELTGVPDTWRASMAGLLATSPRLLALQKALVLYNLEALLLELDDALLGFSAGINYLEPLRATAQRYYRREEVSIDELDPKGLNTTFFLQGLSVRERDQLNEWLRSTFGFALSVKTAGGHTSLNIETVGSGFSRNMADVGLGYSQLAPVAIQLWSATRRGAIRSTSAVRGGVYAPQQYRERSAVVVVEQPELHLHPAYQAKLADVFAACVKSPENQATVGRHPLRILAETHSPNLINRLGELVGSGALRSEHVQVLVFESEPGKNAATSIRTATFDEEGILQNWPIGFFEY
jgi:AAA ATPase domain